MRGLTDAPLVQNETLMPMAHATAGDEGLDLVSTHCCDQPQAAADSAAGILTSVAVVIVDYKTPALVIDCLKSLESERASVPDLIVWICENGGDEDSLRQIRECVDQHQFGDWVTVIAAMPNRGFSGGNNVAIRRLLECESVPQNILLLNSDTIVRAGAIRELLGALDQNPGSGIVGPRLEWPDATPQPSCFRDRSPLNELVRAANTGVISACLPSAVGTIPVSDASLHPDWISFACVLIRREVLEECGLLDQGYFMYFDDTDYCRTVRKAGWNILYWPQAHVVHLRGGSGPVKALTAARKRRPQYWYQSRSRYYLKHCGRLGLVLANFMWTAGRAVSWMRELLRTKQPHTCERELRDTWRHTLSSCNGEVDHAAA